MRWWVQINAKSNKGELTQCIQILLRVKLSWRRGQFRHLQNTNERLLPPLFIYHLNLFFFFFLLFRFLLWELNWRSREHTYLLILCNFISFFPFKCFIQRSVCTWTKTIWRPSHSETDIIWVIFLSLLSLSWAIIADLISKSHLDKRFSLRFGFT